MESIATEKISDILSAETLDAAFQAQSELFERFISMARSPDEPEVVKMLQSLGSAHQKIKAYSRALDQELENCRQIQENFLPKQLPSLSGWHIEEFFFPG